MSNLFEFCVAATVDDINPADRAHPSTNWRIRLKWISRATGRRRALGYFEHVPKDRVVTVGGVGRPFRPRLWANRVA